MDSPLKCAISASHRNEDRNWKPEPPLISNRGRSESYQISQDGMDILCATASLAQPGFLSLSKAMQPLQP
jgi:hypothetical protein